MIEILKTLWKVTEWRDGAVYKTKELGEHWIREMNREEENRYALSLGGDFFTSVSTTRMVELNYKTVRMAK